MGDSNKKFIIISILLVLSIGVIFICNKDSKKVQLDEVKLKDLEEDNSVFAIMVQQEANSENYILYEEETWPTDGYVFNSEKSGCLDSGGKKISDIQLNYAEGKVKVETDETSYCYIYFDKEEPMNLRKACEGQSNMKECITNKSTELVKIENLKNSNKGDLAYRYVGTQDEDKANKINNYVCFGDENCSTGATDNHMYRIIGITEEGNLKIQKNKALESRAVWNNNYETSVCSGTNCTWPQSTMYTNTLKSTFYGSETYVSQGMKDKIDTTHKWNTGDVNGTSTSKIGNGTTVYNLEYSSGNSSYTGEIGLAYLSDYYYSYDEQGNQNCYKSPYCKSWMIPSYNSGLWSTSYEWTMTRYGLDGGSYGSWLMQDNGMSHTYPLYMSGEIRPVFYLNSDVTISVGEGTLSSPYIIN